MLSIESVHDKDLWNDTLRTLPYTHVLQTWEWGEFKRITTGWQPRRLAFKRGGEIAAMASVGVRRVGPLNVMYIPKGPAMDYGDAEFAAKVLDSLQQMARRERAVWLKMDPDVIAATGIPGGDDDLPDAVGSAMLQILRGRGWRFSDDQVQFRNTITIDLTHDEDTLLAQMSSNTRRKVRTAERKGVVIRDGTTDDLHVLYNLYCITGQRDGFITRPMMYYEQAWRAFMAAGLAHALIAEVDGRAVAHIILFHFGRKCWYFYGASSNEERQRMPNYLLQWEAMRWAKSQGCTVYDMWGAPDIFDESDGMWGVYEFKRGFRGVVTRHIGAYDYAPSAAFYAGYTKLWPHILNLMKRRG